MDAPTPDQVRSRSVLVAQRYPDDAAGDAALALQTEVLAPIISDLTGRSIGGAPGEEVPDYLVPVAQLVFALKIERHPRTAREREKALRNLNLRSISAGPWSESYFGPGEAAQVKRLDLDAETHEALWALATPEKRSYWLVLWGDPVPPAAAVQPFNWRRRSMRSPRRV